jgi:Mrp family chromosome partitioning ATPase
VVHEERIMSQNYDLLNQIEAEFIPAKVLPRIVPEEARPVTKSQPAAIGNEILGLAQTLFLAKGAERPHTVVFCGVDRENGSSDICFQLGRVLAEYSGEPVCLLDADTVSSSLSKLAGIGGPGLAPTSARAAYPQIAQELWLADARMSGLAPDGVLGTAQQLKARILDLRRSFEFILIDAPAVTVRSDAAVLGQIADGVVMVIEAHSTRKAVALSTKRAFEGMNVRLFGTVLRNRTFPIPEALYRIL